jgi:hypothetical protein
MMVVAAVVLCPLLLLQVTRDYPMSMTSCSRF